MGTVQGHSNEGARFQGLKDVAYVCRPMGVGAAGNGVSQFLGCLGEKFSIVGFGNQNMDPPVLEGGGAGKQILMPEAKNPGAEISGGVNPNAKRSHPNCGQGSA